MICLNDVPSQIEVQLQSNQEILNLTSNKMFPVHTIRCESSAAECVNGKGLCAVLQCGKGMQIRTYQCSALMVLRWL